MINLLNITYKDEKIKENSLYMYQDYGYDEEGNYYRANAWYLMLDQKRIRFEMFRDTMLKFAHDYAEENNIKNIYIKFAVEGR